MADLADDCSTSSPATAAAQLRRRIDAHFARLPARYQVELNMNRLRLDDVLLHIEILEEAEDPAKRPVFFVRFVKSIEARVGDCSGVQQLIAVGSSTKNADNNSHDGDFAPNFRERKLDFTPFPELEGFYLGVKTCEEVTIEKKYLTKVASHNLKDALIHEIIISSVDKPKLLTQLSAMLSEVGLNIREAHAFSTTDGYSLDVFVVDGWFDEGTDSLLKELNMAATRYFARDSWSGSSNSAASERLLTNLPKVGDCQLNGRLLKLEERIASGSCGDLYRGTYMREDVAVKILEADHITESLEKEFHQEVSILKKVNHTNVVRFIGACTEPRLLIVTEYMTGGNLYDFLHKKDKSLEHPQLLKYAIDICKGMDYLHQNNIIHRDLKTANLLMDAKNVVKVADFGVARFQNQGVMTAETGTYRWMAPEVINHQCYDHKADVFSFAIVLWELSTSRIPYEKLTPLQAALGVRQGMRPELPVNVHPKLLDIMQRCWHQDPAERPSFQEILTELEELLHLGFTKARSNSKY